MVASARLLLLAQVVTAVELTCIEELENMMSRFGSVFPEDSYSTMAVASGKSANDLGDFVLCEEVKEAKYVLFSAYRSGTWIMSSGVSIGLCGPSLCSLSDYTELLSANHTDSSLALFFTHTQNMKSAHFHLKNTQSSPDSVDIRVVFPQGEKAANNSADVWDITLFLVILALLMLVAAGTFSDIQRTEVTKAIGAHMQMMEVDDKRTELVPQENSESLASLFLHSFSLYSNIPKLFSLKSDRESLDVLHSIRVLSMLWIIYGHVCQFRLTVNPLKNYYEIYDKMKEWRYAFVYGAEYSVDIFFAISGLLMSLLFLQALKQKDNLKRGEWVALYVHRLYRILPGYAFILFALWGMLKYMGSGPLWFQHTFLSQDCGHYWWSNLLFINNFVPDWKGNMCLTQSWYLANDMQFFLFSPPLLYLYHRGWKPIAWVILAATCAVSIGLSAIIAEANGYSAVAIAPGNETFYYYFYTKPYTRMSAYALGIAGGMVLHSLRVWKQSGEVYDSTALSVAKAIDIYWCRWIFYITGAALLNAVIFLHYSAYRDVESQWSSWSSTDNILFLSFSHFSFSLGFVLILQPILHGYIRWFHIVFGHCVWAPLSRLTFCVYLVHLHLVVVYFLNAKTAYWVDDLSVAIDLVFSLSVSYLSALILTLLIESPFLAFEKKLQAWRKAKVV